MTLYAIQQRIGGRWTRTGVGGERMLTERGANGQVMRPVVVNGRPDPQSEALLHNRFPESFDVADRVQATQAIRAYLGRGPNDVRMVEIVGVHCDPDRKRMDPPDPWWVATRSVPVRDLPPCEDDRLAFFLSDPRPTGFECTREEAEAVIAWAETLPGWERTHRPDRVETRAPRGPGQKRGRAKVRRWIGWTGYQLHIEDAA